MVHNGDPGGLLHQLLHQIVYQSGGLLHLYPTTWSTMVVLEDCYITYYTRWSTKVVLVDYYIHHFTHWSPSDTDGLLQHLLHHMVHHRGPGGLLHPLPHYMVYHGRLGVLLHNLLHHMVYQIVLVDCYIFHFTHCSPKWSWWTVTSFTPPHGPPKRSW